MFITTKDTYEMDIYECVQDIVINEYTDVPTEDKLDMIQDVFLWTLGFYLRNHNKSWFKNSIHTRICKHCDLWIRKHTRKEISLYDVQLIYEINDSHIINKELCRLLNDNTDINDREFYIIKAYMYDGKTLMDIGKELHISYQRVNTILKSTINKYRMTSFQFDITYP